LTKNKGVKTMSSKQVNGVDDVKNLFNSSTDDGDLSAQASMIMINSLDGTNLAGCMGTSVDDLETDDVTIVSTILDASLSMKSFEATVRDAYDKLIKSLQGSKQAGSILVSNRTFSTYQNVLHGFKKVEEIDPIGTQYRATGGSTALYDALLEALTGIKAYSKSLNQNGVRTKCIIVVFSDGDDNDSRNASASDVKTISVDLLKSEMFYLVYIGYLQDPSSNLQAIADLVGFPNVLTTSATESEIRRTMDLVSKSIIRTSQTQIGSSNSFFS
jgi:uncharacterized protein YegL